MIVVDTSVWVDHFRASDPILVELILQSRVLVHPLVVGELSLGNLRRWRSTMDDMLAFAQPETASFEETLNLIETQQLMASGLTWIDAALLASTTKTGGASLWTRDKRLAAAADRLRLNHLTQ